MSRAVPAHTIVRYRPMTLSFYASWQPVEVMRFRLFVDASHEDVTGEARGAPWVNDWSCETLSTKGGTWRINGRNEWATIDEAIKVTSAGTFATFGEALAAARASAEIERAERVRALKRIGWNLDEINNAKPPVLPP